MNKVSGFALVPIFVIVFLACAAQAAAPVSPPESRFVLEPGENLTFTWTPDNFDGFYYDPENKSGNESLTIKLNNIKDRSIPIGGIVYHKAAGQTNTKYREFGKYAVIEFTGEKYLAEYPAGKSNITGHGEIKINQIRLRKILIDDNTSNNFINGSRMMLSLGHDIEIRDVNISDSSVLLSLKMDGAEVDTRTLGAKENYTYETKDGQIIAVQVDSVIAGREENSVSIKRIFQTSESFTQYYKKVDIFGVMKVTDISDTGITMRNTAVSVDLKPGSIIEVMDNIRIKVADSNDLRLYLYRDWGQEKSEHRGALRTASNNLTAWDGLNYAGFWYDFESGNYSESLEITNMTGRRIPENGLTYTSYRANISYVIFSLGGKKYTARNNGFAELLIAHGDSIYEKKALVGKPSWFEWDDELKSGRPVAWEPGMDTWELGEGYALTVKYIDTRSDPRKARLVLSRNGVDLDDVWLSSGNAYRYFQPGETGTSKLITYLDAVFAGATVDVIQLRNTVFVSDNVTQIKDGDRLGVFNVTVMDPDRIELKNREPIDLEAGSSINLLGNLSFFVENSDELRFYPTNVASSQAIPGEVTENSVLETHNVTTQVGKSPVAAQTKRAAGFEVIISIAIILAAYIAGRKMM
ncbi:MAG: hypothetical protein FIB07_03195 [Candidatus Methanoperedens sp.]|nr:hypothetical protein [Candidatus Methanoperedens sp.]